MKAIPFLLLLLGTVCCLGCIKMQQSNREQRVVELPANHPDANLNSAAQIGQALIAGGLGADLQKQFPSLTQQQLNGVYITWNAGDFGGEKSVFFLTGIQYSGTLPEAKAIADYCESRLKQAVAARFEPVSP